ncbi:heparinase II/III family protein [Cryptococcus neoformans]|nr:heparinase II/III family protein [Cryptococcus neoformans var. grubii]OXC62766.1 heparinase II/III family protein [Cryptococcus neoformans var. grubii MW-RSA852]
MAHYQQAPYSDSPGYGNSYGGSAPNYGGYSDNPRGAAGGDYGNSYLMSSANPNAAVGSGGYADGAGGFQPKKKRNKWLWIGLPVLLICIILAAVLGGVLGSRASNDNKDSSTSSDSSSATTGVSNANTALPSGVSSANTAATNTGANGEQYLAVATDTYMLPVYATGTATSGYSAPTAISDPASTDSWPEDPSPPSNSTQGIRPHPRLAPGYKWDALTHGGLIQSNPYFKYWNATIVQNASDTIGDDPTPYVTDGGLDGSGVLDVAREIKLKVKNWAYAYKVTNETKYADRVWLELTTAAGNNSEVSFGADDNTRWNAAHFLDLAEFCAAFAIGYDWLYDFWTDDQRNALMWSMLNLGLSFGHAALTGDASASSYSWWAGTNVGSSEVNGNWNCVCNGGLIQAAVAIVDRDPTGMAQQVIDLAVPDAWNNCFQGAYSDGTWAETANYWYFGTTGAAELVNALQSSYGDDRGLPESNPGWNLTSLFHIYVQGMTSLFNYGDHGPNKYSSTANSLLFWANTFNEPRYALYQRDHYDASEPWSMFWYNPALSGTWWDGLPLDRYFDDENGRWATARSNWATNEGSYWAMKASKLTGHQTHGDLDIGDFVFDAMGQRWAGELGSGQYLSDGYFSSEAQNSERWLYYRKRTEGQNTLLINDQNQNVNATPTGNWGSSGTAQGPAPSFQLDSGDTAYFWTDMSSAYNYTVKRGIRYLNTRQQVLIQDDVTDVPNLQWRMHTNATITTNNATATLALSEQTLIASIVQGPSGASFSTAEPTRSSSDPALPTGTMDADQPNDGVTVLVVDVPNGGTFSLQVLLTPQWGSGFTAMDTVNNVALDDWSLTSH